jgi:hypothetical protein
MDPGKVDPNCPDAPCYRAGGSLHEQKMEWMTFNAGHSDSEGLSQFCALSLHNAGYLLQYFVGV